MEENKGRIITKKEEGMKTRFIQGAVVIITVVMLYLTFHPLVINSKKEVDYKPHKLISKGEIVNVLENHDFDSGKWEMYLIIAESDKVSISKDIPNGNIFKTEDKNLLKEMKKNCRFIYEKSDIATIESEIFLLKNENIVFRGGIVLDENMQGLQLANYGWLKVSSRKALSKYCKRLNRVYSPIVIL